MKKCTKKLNLAKETVINLHLQSVLGGTAERMDGAALGGYSECIKCCPP